MDVVDETQDVVDVLDPVDGVRGVPKPCAQVRILPGALAELLVRTLRGSGVTRRPVGIPSFIPSFGSRFDRRASSFLWLLRSPLRGSSDGAKHTPSPQAHRPIVVFWALLRWRKVAPVGEGGVMRPHRSRPISTVPSSVFKGFRFPPEIIVLALRWYLRYGLSYRDVEELLGERGIEVDHVTIYRWVQRFTPLLADAAPGRADTWSATVGMSTIPM